MTRSLSIILVSFALAGAVRAQDSAGSDEAKSREASATFVETQHFIVGRIGRDCLEEIGRKETPVEFQAKWQHDNARYFDAARKYLASRLKEIENPEARDTMERAYYDSAQKAGEAATAQLFSKVPENEICKSARTLVDSGNMNIDEFAQASQLPITHALGDLAH